ncbi:MAG: Hpt domain-containing protein, partial [Planctomycetes bacterium]|nr:Hpt domain-containing protein [Planctomycetota bacterium]
MLASCRNYEALGSREGTGMTIGEIANSINRAAATLMQFDEDTSPKAWRDFTLTFADLEAKGKEHGWQVLVDAALLSQELLTGLANKHFPHPQQAISHLEKLISILTTVSEDLQNNSPQPRSFKAEFAAVRVFLNDLKHTGLDVEKTGLPSSPADLNHEEAEFQRIMLEHINSIEQILLNLPDGKPAPKAMGDVFREFHTLKGETGILGMKVLSHFFHSIESALEPVRGQTMAINANFITALMAVTDLSRLLVTEGPDLEETSEKVQDTCLRDLCQAIVESPLGEEVQPAVEPAEEGEDDDFFAAMADANPAAGAAEKAPAVNLEALQVE